MGANSATPPPPPTKKETTKKKRGKNTVMPNTMKEIRVFLPEDRTD